MSASVAPPHRAARLAGAALIGIVPVLVASGAHAQDATTGGPPVGAPPVAAPPVGPSPMGLPPVGLPPAAVMLNSPIGGLPSTLGQSDLRYMPAVPAAGGPRAPAFSIVPSIGVAEMYNSNIFQSETNPKGDFVTAITPGIQITGSTPRVTANLQYSPSFLVYAGTRSADSIAHQGIGSVTAELVPDTLFVTARALASVQPAGGGLGGLGLGQFGSTSPLGSAVGSTSAPGALALDSNNLTQNFGASITPYVVHRFGDFGTAKVGLTLTESYSTNNGELNPIPGTVSVGTQRQQTGEATAQFQSGPDFGRVRDFAVVDAARSTGTGVSNGSRSDTATNWAGYALNRAVMPFVELGAESIHYNTAPATNIDDAVWLVGVVLTPNPDSQLSLGYGHQQGANSPDIRGYYQITPRSRVSVSYTTQLATNIQQIENQLALTSFDQFGNAVDVQTGAPLFLGNGLLSTQNALFRTHSLSLTGTTVLDRDTINVSVQHQNQTPVGSAPGSSAGIGEEVTSFSAGWTHQISERTSLGLGGSYSLSSFETTPSGTERSFSATAGASYLLSDTVSTVARYSFFNRSSNFAGRTFADNIFLLSLTKRF